MSLPPHEHRLQQPGYLSDRAKEDEDSDTAVGLTKLVAPGDPTVTDSDRVLRLTGEVSVRDVQPLSPSTSAAAGRCRWRGSPC